MAPVGTDGHTFESIALVALDEVDHDILAPIVLSA